jgi:hypothetical protein
MYSSTLAADIYHVSGNYAFALGDFNQAIEMRPNVVDAYHHRGNLYFDMQAFDLAIKDYEKILELDPNHYKAANSTFRASQNCYPESILMRLLPSDIAIIYRHQQQYDLAIKEYQRAITMNEKFCDSHYNLGNVFQIQCKYEEALHEYSRAVEEGEVELKTIFRPSHMVPPPTVIKFCVYKAKMLYFLGRYTEARDALEYGQSFRRVIDQHRKIGNDAQDGEEEESNVKLTKFMVENRLGNYDTALADACWLSEHESTAVEFVSNWVLNDED